MSTGLMSREHTVLLSAAAKSGKTTMTYGLARSLVDEVPFLDRYRVTPLEGHIGIVDGEMTHSDCRQWFRAMNVKHPERVSVWFLRGQTKVFRITQPSVLRMWVDDLIEKRVTFLVIDPLLPFLAANGLDENSATDVARFTGALDQLCKEAGVKELLVAHHFGHAGGRGRGSSRLQDWPDVHWLLDRDEETDVRYFRAYGRGVEVPESELDFDPVTKLFTAQIGVGRKASQKRHRDRRTERDVLDAVGKRPGLGRNEVYERVGGRKGDVLRALEDLIELGMIKELPGKGKAKLNYLPEDLPEGGGSQTGTSSRN